MNNFRFYALLTFLIMSPVIAGAQSYTLESTWNTTGAAGGLGISSEDVIFVSNNDLGSVNKINLGVIDATATVWTNPGDAGDTVSLVGGAASGPRGIVVDPFGNLLTLSNDADHNVLVWDTSLAATSKRLKTSLASGSDGRIYAIDTDSAGRLYVFVYFNIPAGHHRLEVYPPVSTWGTSHQETPLSSTTLDEPTPLDAHEGMCVNAAGTVVWYNDRGARKVYRLTGTPATGYTVDSGFSLDLANGTASTGFRAMELSLDESKLFLCDNYINEIIVADSTTGSIDSGLTFSTGTLPAYDVELDSEANAYVSYFGPPMKIDKFKYVTPTPTTTPSPTNTPTATPTGTIYPTSTPTTTPTNTIIPFDGKAIVDNSDPGCSVQGAWSTQTSNCYGPNKFSHAVGTGSNTVTWTADLPEGWYLVYFYMSDNTTYATDARYSVTHRDGTSNLTVSQRKATDGWYILGGAYYFNAPTSVVLSDYFTGGTSVVADGIKFVSVFSFVQMSDSHVGYGRGTTNTTDVANELKTLGSVGLGTYGFSAPPPSFAIHSGDFTEYGQEYWSTLMSVFSGMPFQVYFVQGNHDSTWSSCKERIKSIHGSSPYSFDHYDRGLRYHFACLNTPIIQSPRAGFSREELDWLSSDLAALESNTPVFINFHHPIDGGADPKFYDTYSFLEAIRPYRIMISFFGHGHSALATTYDGLQMVEGGSTYNDSTDIGCYNLITVTSERICVAKKVRGEATAATNILDYTVPATPVYPTITVTSPVKNSTQTGASVSVSASISNAAGTVTSVNVELDNDANWRSMTGTGYGPYSGSISMTSLIHGRHWIRIRFSMSTGNTWYKMVPFWHWDGIPQLEWIVDLEASSLSTPAIASGKVYIGANGGSMRCLNAFNGQEVWSVDVPSDVVSMPAVADGRVIFGCGDSKIYCLDAASGSEIWSVTCSGPAYSSPTIDGGNVYIGTIGTGDSGSRYLYSIDASDGSENWKFSAGNAIETKPCLYDNTVFFGAWDSYFYAVYADTGIQRWRYQRNASRYYSPADSWPVVSSSANMVYVADRQYYLNPIDIATGTTSWTQTSVASQAITPDGAGLLQRVSSGNLARTTFGNSPVWTAACSLDSAPSSPMCNGTRTVVVDQDGLASVVSLDSGSIEYQFQLAQGYQLNAANIDQSGNIYASTYDGFLLCVHNSLSVGGWTIY